ncbi:MAG: hypothetical protein M3N49_00080 [Candidatus Eremiobacteraeota bacterium]|nr:hypothetical protein [Candidatus Eremiobacteraeota bacterium]
MADEFVRGMIVAYYAREGAIPDGWAICDGTNGTPDLREKYLVGVDALGDVGHSVGSAQHRHNVNASGSTDRNRVDPDAWGFDGPDRGKAPQATGLDHRHTFSAVGDTDAADNRPPSITVIFLMKL